jgi:hypothetical protein
MSSLSQSVPPVKGGLKVIGTAWCLTPGDPSPSDSWGPETDAWQFVARDEDDWPPPADSGDGEPPPTVDPTDYSQPFEPSPADEAWYDEERSAALRLEVLRRREFAAWVEARDADPQWHAYLSERERVLEAAERVEAQAAAQTAQRVSRDFERFLGSLECR